jgi:uncharacterized membrane protein YbaN (DUF454 family)
MPHSGPVAKNVFVQPVLSDIPGAKAKQDISMINVLFMAMADDRRMTIEQDISRPVPPIPCKAMHYLMLALGLICTALGIVGIILPVMPGTVFLLIAVWAFSRSSEKLHLWLFYHPRFGQTIRAWHQYRAIPLRAKVLAVTMMAASFTYVAVMLNQNWLVPVLVGAILAPVAIWIATRPVPARG